MMKKKEFNETLFNRANPLLDISVINKETGRKFQWHQFIKDVPEGPTIVISQEFFDALPVYQFQVIYSIKK